MCSTIQNPFLQVVRLLVLFEHYLQGQHHETYQMYVLQQQAQQFLHRSSPSFQMFLLCHEHLLKDLDFHLVLEDLHKLDPFELQQEDYLTLSHLYIFCYPTTLILNPNGCLLQGPIYLVFPHCIQM